ncbi:MAG: ATP-binding cassette domain-containing protein [Phycisphaerae bacterium]|nr:ATP-binding cassette domain-containing protein [Phycisphaerae bacterium]
MIQAERLSKLFPHPEGGEIRAVDGLTFHVAPGEIYGLLGPNGAGKTTTLRILSGLIRPTGGRAILNGHDVVTDLDGVKRSIGFMTANTGLYQRLSPRELLAYFAELHGMDRARGRRRIDELIDLVGMADFADLRCGGLSTGQRQRTNIARALVADPPILILDEPTLGLDVLTNRVIVEFIRREGSQGKAVLLSTHRMGEAESLCDRIGLIHHGRLIAEGTFADLQRQSGEERLGDIFLRMVELADANTNGVLEERA